MLSTLNHIRERRTDLRNEIDLAETFEQWEETCVPSYCHKNWLAAYVSWQRLFRSVELAKSSRPNPGRVMDFGSSVGELGHLLRPICDSYEFVEQDEPAASYLTSRLPHATRTTLEDAVPGTFDWVFAIDSLEHNDNFAELVEIISTKLSDDGIFIDIEVACRNSMELVKSATVMPGIPLFSITVWRKKQS